jgi:uncharacterized protein YbbC (DUF1343 family)
MDSSALRLPTPNMNSAKPGLVQTGLDILAHAPLESLNGKRVGLVTHPAAVRPDLTNAVDALLEQRVQLTALFGPEHGFDGSAADATAVRDSIHSRTGLPVFSLYGPDKEPTAAMLANVDVLLFDMQDVGARFYTFISTLYHVLHAASKHNRPVIVLDRPNPINGSDIEGPLVEPGLESFIGILPIPIRHGMTCGELARYINAELKLSVDLTVVTLRGWRRSMWFDEIGLPWVPLSPGMPHLSTATVYPGTCLIEGTNISEGRGTALPFEIIGAPWLDGYALAQELNGRKLDGVRFRGVSFKPEASKHQGQTCHGVQVHVTDRSTLRPVLTGLHILAACRAYAPQQFEFLPTSWEGSAPHIDLLMGDARTRTGLLANQPVPAIAATWVNGLARFAETRAKYLLY